MGTEDGARISDVVTDIARVEAEDRERTGWPGQVPVGLLERIIEASSEPRDLVLDPFCGSGTACVAAEQLDRDWIGIESNERAFEILQNRLRGEIGDVWLYRGWARSDDAGIIASWEPDEVRKHLYEDQGGRWQRVCSQYAYPSPLTQANPPRLGARSRQGRKPATAVCSVHKSDATDATSRYAPAVSGPVELPASMRHRVAIEIHCVRQGQLTS